MSGVFYSTNFKEPQWQSYRLLPSRSSQPLSFQPSFQSILVALHKSPKRLPSCWKCQDIQVRAGIGKQKPVSKHGGTTYDICMQNITQHRLWYSFTKLRSSSGCRGIPHFVNITLNPNSNFTILPLLPSQALCRLPAVAAAGPKRGESEQFALCASFLRGSVSWGKNCTASME